MNRANQLITETPPIQQPMRFGNRAFKLWHERFCSEANTFIRDELLPENLKDAAIELAPYICAGTKLLKNALRVDSTLKQLCYLFNPDTFTSNITQHLETKRGSTMARVTN